MPRKKSDKAYGEKLIWLFAELYFAGGRRSLIELAEKLNCSKQTIIRLVNDISRAYVPIEEIKENRRSYYQIRRPDKLTPMSMSASELSMLYMCLGFTRHLLGDDLLRESEKAIQKSSTLAAGVSVAEHFAAFLPGTIDYTPRQQDIRRLMTAMDEKTVCKISYKKPLQRHAKTFYVKPYRLFSHNNALYLHAGMARYPGSRITTFEFDPLLAVHRFRKVELTERKFTVPQNYDFEKLFNQAFGVIKQEPFQVKLDLKGYAAALVRERRLSPDQKIRNRKEGLALTFSASSRPEVLAWVLSLGDEARVLEPDWLVDYVRQTVAAMSRQYQ